MAINKMLLGMAQQEVYGAHPGAWRMPSAPDNAFTDVEVQVNAAQMAEQGGLDYIFYPDRVFIHDDLKAGPPMFFSMEPLMILSVIAHATQRIGLVASASTSFNEPYTLARQLRALDVISHGRAGWNAIPSYEPEAFANYGYAVPSSEAKYERLHESIQIVQALWGSWGREAGKPDKANGRFANTHYIQSVNLRGNQVGSHGPLQIPPSEQGQPVIFMPLASGSAIHAAALYANGIIAMPTTIDEGREQVALVIKMATQVGRATDDIKLLAFITLSLGETQEEALAHRMALDEIMGIDWATQRISAVLGINIDPSQMDTPLTPTLVASLRPRLAMAQSHTLAELVKQEKTPRQILAYGLYERAPSVVGSPEQVVDIMQAWIEAGACHGFTILLNDYQHDLPIFINQVIPLLKQRGLRSEDYTGTTLRDHFGIGEQLGLDPRIKGK